MKRKILLILNMAIIGFSTAACSDDETNYITPEKKYQLKAYAVACLIFKSPSKRDS